ncbi:MAG: heparinase II/III family protein [Planctomycetia bacterium]|nr:heparinase II/III family protein [Planctomycetia bacterium]
MGKRYLMAGVVVSVVAGLSGFSAQSMEPTIPEVVQVPAHQSFMEVSVDAVNEAFANLSPHPRLLLTEEELAGVREKIGEDSRWRDYYEALRRESDLLIAKPSVERRLTGRRLLSVSREALRRIFAWSFLYRYTGESTYARRVEQELLAIAAFSDWNPSHFLDTAEMTMAVAIGYDACSDALSASSKETIRKAILEKGIAPSLKKSHQHWFRNTANWNQVCHAGMGYGALALAEEEPELARAIVRRSANGITWSMSAYEPDGNYTEGPGYWGYGTSFNLMWLAGLRSSLGTDFGRGGSNGLVRTIDYYEHVFGTTGLAYNYPDSGGGRIFEPTVFWFVDQTGDPSKAWNEAKWMYENQWSGIAQSRRPDAPSFGSMVGHRLAPCALLWGDNGTMRAEHEGRLIGLPPAPQSLGFVGIGDGRTPVAFFRTSWEDASAAYLGIKAGTPSAPHGHMDIGSFVYDADGVRWAAELGPENYHKIESLGMGLWSAAQDSDRWKLFRYSNFSHNTLTINGRKQLISGRCGFLSTHVASGERRRYSDPSRTGESRVTEPTEVREILVAKEDSSAVIDMTPVYRDEVESAIRTAVLSPDGTLTIRDSLRSLPEKEAVVEWRFLTPATVTPVPGGDSGEGVHPEKDAEVLVLRQPGRIGGKGGDSGEVQRTLRYTCPYPVTHRIESADGPETFDAKNPGYQLLILTVRIPAGSETELKVRISE